MIEYFKKIYNGSSEYLYNILEENIKCNKKMFIVTANPETLMNAERNAKLRQALMDENTTIIADGIGIVKGSKILKCNIEENIPGIEICEKLLKICNENKKSIYLFGAQENVIEALVQNIKEKYHDIVISGYCNGYANNKQEVFNNIAIKKPDVVLIALGIPTQELLIFDNLSKFEKGIFVGVGGSFDVLSGLKKRAPKAFRRLKLEWLYRIAKEPKRLKRFIKYNVKYIFKLLKEKIV